LFYGGLVGVAFALVGLIWKGRVRHAIVNFAGFVRAAVSPGTPATPLRTDQTLYVPYGAALGLGALWQVALSVWLSAGGRP
ncbi:MAG: hypothetical protein KC466_10765, partial [Myxococcales bacterium]|nr:hypothetical protein [Myxococcales bacterium]